MRRRYLGSRDRDEERYLDALDEATCVGGGENTPASAPGIPRLSSPLLKEL